MPNTVRIGTRKVLTRDVLLTVLDAKNSVMQHLGLLAYQFDILERLLALRRDDWITSAEFYELMVFHLDRHEFYERIIDDVFANFAPDFGQEVKSFFTQNKIRPRDPMC